MGDRGEAGTEWRFYLFPTREKPTISRPISPWKSHSYLANGAQLVVVLDPIERTIVFMTLTEPRRTRKATASSPNSSTVSKRRLRGWLGCRR